MTRVVIDTDAANEIDDQFAIAWALLAPERLRVEAITAAPYSHGHYLAALRAATAVRGGEPATPFEELAASFTASDLATAIERRPPRIGMERSHAEIQRIVDAADVGERPAVLRGAEQFLTDAGSPVDSDAARAIVELANTGEDRLHVAVLGAPTNVASALLIDPSIAERITVVFVAGYPTGSRHVDDSFNLVQDRVATNRIFAPDVHHVYLPGYHVAETLAVSLPELDAHLAGHGVLADVLVQLFRDNPLAADPEIAGFHWVMWDLAPIAWLIDPSWLRLTTVDGASVDSGHRWQRGPGTLTEAYRIDRKAVYGDLFARFAQSS